MDFYDEKRPAAYGMPCPLLNPKKVYVSVEASFDSLGNMSPRAILWEDGRRFPIDRVTNLCHAASSKAGGHGDRYSILVCGQASYLFFERKYGQTGSPGRWFVEKK